MSEQIPVLIVEDDRIILEDILNMIDWEAAGFRVVATAGNGKLGCIAYEQHQPELIIADIQMPVMDGLTMLRQLRHINQSLSFLILSSYSEFEYAKEAVRLNTDSYLLKTELSPEILLDTLSPIREKILSRRSMRKFTTQHQLFALLSALVERGTSPPPSAEQICAAFRTYWNTDPGHTEQKMQIQWMVRECYASLGIAERSAPCDSIDVDSVEQWLVGEYSKLSYLYECVCEKNCSPVIINASEYIRANYASSQLKISSVAEYVGLSSSRLSVLFKQEMNQTVNDFITQTRISVAKQLLQSGRYKVYEVSAMVGYKTSQYFSQIFLQCTGLSPTDYLRRESP